MLIARSLRYVVLLVVITASGALLVGVLAQPHGGWDAWAIWNLHARMLSRAADWRTLFQVTPYSHPDYPLLLPGLVVLGWRIVGSEMTVVPAAIALLFSFATGALLFAALRTLRGTLQATLATTLLLGTSTFLAESATQTADVPLGFFVLATVALLTTERAQGGQRPALAVGAGVAAGLALWTKNEGALLVVAVACVLGVGGALRRDRRRAMLCWAAGVAPFLATLVAMKLAFAPPNDLIAGQSAALIIAKLCDPARYLAVITTSFSWLLRFGRGAIIVLVLYALLVGQDRAYRSLSTLSFATTALMLAGYFLVYIITPYDIHWHVTSSILRLLLHVWPTIIFGVFLVVRVPEQLIKPQTAYDHTT